MKNLLKFMATLSIIAICTSLSALPPGSGSQHIRFSGIEVFTAIAPDYSTFTSVQTLRIPSLQVDEHLLILQAETTVMEFLGDGFYMCGKIDILAADGTVVGAGGFVSRTHILEPTVEQPWSVDVSLTGAIWGGPLGGLVLTENILGGGTTVPWFYQGAIEGFFMVPEFVDVDLLKASLAN